MKELFKKFGALLLCGTLLFSAACGAKGDGSDSAERFVLKLFLGGAGT